MNFHLKMIYEWKHPKSEMMLEERLHNLHFMTYITQTQLSNNS